MRKICNLLAFPALALLLAAAGPNTAAAQTDNPGGRNIPIGRLCQFIVAHQDDFGDDFRSFETVGDCARAVATLGPVLCKRVMDGDEQLGGLFETKFSTLGECVSFIQRLVRDPDSCSGIGLIFLRPTANDGAVAAPDKSVCRAAPAPRSATRSAA